ncbi:MAG: restriction endonuclease subunit S [Lachnospiraceae bacterium]|jgi:type I restriction enzyme S subunit|nr:restriction endonuclease subunit S [Lachnospiraceae bacterium]MCH4031781.1 restriction endonuclease subunit S [Lachnospiraceae bacterium]MCH4108335.1 restriction endonuclease subunit S [Lachnospiraceae bacterium]MCI1380805.1 restriction endonuclease subunit S [Lachnospiraceae bacterium]MCI1401425.1 restriction endonuclease subunit S [Lachnospiraceae bacterium]
MAMSIMWNRTRVGNLGKVVTGKTPKTKESDNYGGNIPFLTPSDDMNVKHVTTTNKTLSIKGRDSVKSSIIPADAVCVSCIGSDLGKVVITTQETVTNQQINSIIVDKANYDVNFVYYSMLILGKRLNAFGKTSTAVPIVNKTSFSNEEILCPDKETQKRVGDVLSALDDKIEENEKINKNLFEQAQALYKDRYIDLSPTDGKIPAGWHIGTVSEIIELHDSKRIPLSSREREKLNKIYPYYGATSVMDYVDRYLFDGIYLLLGEDGTVVDDNGFPVLQYVEGKFWVNNHAHVITGKCGFTVELLYLLFSLTNVKSIVTGAVQPKISQANLNRVPILIPDADELESFNSVIQPFFAQIRNLRVENDRLATLRDTLLPRLMSGEIDVSSIDL